MDAAEGRTMERVLIFFTAVYLRGEHGIDGFVEELPEVNFHGRTIEEAREGLRRATESMFREQRALSAELLKGRHVVREQFLVGICPRREDGQAHLSWSAAGERDVPPRLALE